MAKDLKRREDVPPADRWDAESVYATDAAWEEDFGLTADFAADAAKWSGRLGESPAVLHEAIKALQDQSRRLEKLFVYANMKQDVDLGNSRYGDMYSRITGRQNEVDTAHSFFTPELLSIPTEKMDAWLEGDVLADYRRWLTDILRYRPHTLSGKEEKLLSMSREVSRGFSYAFGKLNNVDRPARLPEITDHQGERVKLTNGNFVSLLQKRDRRVRKDAFEGYYTELAGNIPTLAALLNGQVKSDIFYARARNYPTALEASLFHDEVDTAVYDALISSVHSNLPALTGYYHLRKRVLELESMHIYDSSVPAVPESKGEYSWDEAVDLTLEAVRPLGDEYVSLLSQGFVDRWADRYENVGKRGGAYSDGCYDTAPFILHNFTGTLSSVFTLAHEAGHSMHSLLSRRAQPYHMSSYRILVAEVASTTNEMLLVDLLMKKLSDPMEKAYLLDHLIGKFKGTLYRQTMFAEFEKLVHEHVESGQSLTTDWLTERYYRLVKQYHGESFAYDGEDEPIGMEWARIPHFYYNFYVYKYATGLASSVDISSRILKGVPGAVENYLDFLRGGASKPPLELLRGAGVDLTTPAPVDSALSVMADAVEDLSQLV